VLASKIGLDIGYAEICTGFLQALQQNPRTPFRWAMTNCSQIAFSSSAGLMFGST
jgi:hypothetical protein